MRVRITCVAVFVVAFFTCNILFIKTFMAIPDGPEQPDICTEVDVVYTWVNGSDPAHSALLKKYNKKWDGGYREYGVLKYSIRSIEKFMPWARNIIIVTNGQVPTWANLSAPRFRIVTHEEIFPDTSVLPTFNSNAIEAHLHKIPNLAPCILYLNDDMFLANHITKDLFIDPNNGRQKIFVSPGYRAPMPDKMEKNIWHRSVGNSNSLINSYYHPDATKVVKHPYVGHVCYFMRKDILDLMYARWKPRFDSTSTHKFRHGNDTAIPFMHAAVAMEEFGAYQSSDVYGMFGKWHPAESENTQFWNSVWRNRPHCVCINDGLDSSSNSIQEIDRLQDLFEEHLPTPSRAELRKRK
ncbi:sugar phosphotransferase [Pelomyxa schiedti]|nr:sugar phosphotransferase [Pelomyxa schiedti]